MDEAGLRPVTISVIVATYGESSFHERMARRRAVPSVCAQTCQPLELIRHRSEGLLHDARNEAAALAHGERLCFLDADDELAPGYLAAMTDAVRALPEGDSALLVPSVQYVRSPGDEDRPRLLDPGRPISEVNRAVIGTLVPAALFAEVGGFSDWPIYEDWDLWLTCLAAGARLVDVPDAVYRAWENRGSRNRQPRHVQVKIYDEIRAFHGYS